MPLEPQFLKPIEAQWSFQVVDMDRRLVAFKDLSVGRSPPGNGISATAKVLPKKIRCTVYKEPGHYVVVLDIQGPAGKSRRSKVWDVMVK